MTAPPEGQKEAPGGAATLHGAVKSVVCAPRNSSDGTEGMFPRGVKAARSARLAWPTWLGARWLKNWRRGGR